MKTLTLCQEVCLNTGVIGTLKLGQETLYTLETQDCLEPGSYKGEFENGKMLIDGKYRGMMDRNGRYRSAGIVAGSEFAFDSFNLRNAGDAIEAIYAYCEGKPFRLVVQRATGKGLDKVNEVIEKLEAERAAEKEAHEAEVAKLVEARERLDAAYASLQKAAELVKEEAKSEGQDDDAK